MIKSELVGSSKIKLVVYLIIILCSIGICLLGIHFHGKQQYQRKIDYAEATIKNETKKLNQINKQVSQLYQDDQEEFLSESLEASSIKTVESTIRSLKTQAEDFGLESKDFSSDTTKITMNKKELMSKINEIKDKYSIQDKVAKLLTQTPTNWENDVAAIVINEKATIEQIQLIRNKISGEKTHLWNKSILTFLDEMDTQVKQYNELKQSIGQMMNGEVLSENASAEMFIHNYNQLLLIKNETLRKELTDKLDVVDKLLENHSSPEGVSNEVEEIPQYE